MIVATPKVLDDMDCYLPDDDSVRRIARFFCFAFRSVPSKALVGIDHLATVRNRPCGHTQNEPNHRFPPTETASRLGCGNVRTAGENTQIQDRQPQNQRNSACRSGVSGLLKKAGILP